MLRRRSISKSGWPDRHVVYMVLEVADLLVERISGATRRVFADTAHMINMERPTEFNQVVLEFLAAHPFS